MRCWKCKSDMPEGLKYCGNCGVHMNRAVHMFQWLFSKKGLPVLIVILALLVGAAAWYIIPKLRMPVIEFDLDMGWYTPDERNIVFEDDSESYGYVNNMILVFFTKDATDEQITEVIMSVDGTVRGIMPGVRQYQIEVSARSMEELEALRKQLMEFDVVKNAVIDNVTTVDGEGTVEPNDPWNDPSSSGWTAAWDENNPDGTNWWVEATKLLSAWGYRDSFSHIDVGIVDNGYDITHEDLQLVILNPEVSNSEDHGTHVAGIMGAIADNGIGITGVLDDVTLQCVDCYASDAQKEQRISVSSLLAGIDLCIYNGSRVVNMSSGLIYDYASASEANVIDSARDAITYLIMMIDAYERDFIVVQSAGNGDNNHNGVDAARYNGWFASITPELVQTVLDEMHADGVKLEKEITVDDVMSSLMVVGAVDMHRVNGSYQLSTFSNYGNTITVCTPGVNILSTVPTGNAYEYFNGTSMAAPLTAGITAMVWSVDQEMSAAQVKDIVVSTATTPVLSRSAGDTGTYYMADALAAVEKALEIAAQPEETEPPVTDDPIQSGSPDRLMPYFDRYVGKENYKSLQCSLVTSGADGLQYYWDVGEVDTSVAAYVDSYMELILEDTYQFELIQENNGEYFYTYTGTGDVDPLGKHEGMSQSVDNCYLWIKLVNEGDVIRFERWCSANFEFVEVLPEPDNQESDIQKVKITVYESDVLTNVYEIFYSYKGYVIEIKNTFYNADGSVDHEEIKAFQRDDQGRLVRYSDSGSGERFEYAYDDTGLLLKETYTGMGQWETLYYYNENGESIGYTTTYPDRKETAVYDRINDSQIQVTRTTEYNDGTEDYVEKWTWHYDESGKTEKTVYEYENSTMTVTENREFDCFVLRTYEDSSGLVYHNLDIDLELGTSYNSTFWSLYMKEYNISCASGRIEHISDKSYDRRFIFEYESLD